MRPCSAGRKPGFRDHAMNASRNARGGMFTHPRCATNGPHNSAMRVASAWHQHQLRTWTGAQIDSDAGFKACGS